MYNSCNQTIPRHVYDLCSETIPMILEKRFTQTFYLLNYWWTWAFNVNMNICSYYLLHGCVCIKGYNHCKHFLTPDSHFDFWFWRISHPMLDSNNWLPIEVHWFPISLLLVLSCSGDEHEILWKLNDTYGWAINTNH